MKSPQHENADTDPPGLDLLPDGHGGLVLDMNRRGLRTLFDLLAVAQAEWWSNRIGEQHPSCRGGVEAGQALLSKTPKLV